MEKLCLRPNDQAPVISDNTNYTRKRKIAIRGDLDYIKSKIVKYSTMDGFYPNFNIKSLGNDIFDLTDAIPDAEPQYLVAKYLPFRYRKEN